MAEHNVETSRRGCRAKDSLKQLFFCCLCCLLPKASRFFFRLQSQRQTESHGAPSPSFSFNNLMRVQKFPSQKSHNSQSISNICIFCVSALSELLTTLVLRGWIVWCVMWNGNHSGWGYVMIQSEIRGKLVVYVMFHGALDTFEMSYGESQLRPNMWVKSKLLLWRL